MKYKESRLRSPRRKELIRPVEFDPKSKLNKEAFTIVSLLRRALAKGGSLDFSLPLDAPPHFRSRILSGHYPIKIEFTYIIQKDNSFKLHKEMVRINYDNLEVDRCIEFGDALGRREVSRIHCKLDTDRRDPIRPIWIDRDSGDIILSGVKIPHWEKKA